MNAHRLGTIAALVAGAGAIAALAVAAARAPDAASAGAPDAGARATVRIQIQTVPPEKAIVMWGRKPLGLIRGPRKPLIVERPRDSGPLDVVIRADGYVPVHTRAYTFTDSKLAIKLTRVTDKKTLFGYREDVAIPDGGVPDGGAPPPPAAVRADAAVPGAR